MLLKINKYVKNFLNCSWTYIVDGIDEILINLVTEDFSILIK